MTYGTDCANAYKILEDTLNLRDVRIYDTVSGTRTERKRVLNSKETTLAQQKQQAIKEAFRDWIWKDPDRRRSWCSSDNERFNSTRPREYDGRHLIYPGMNPRSPCGSISSTPSPTTSTAAIRLAHEGGRGQDLWR